MIRALHIQTPCLRNRFTLLVVRQQGIIALAWLAEIAVIVGSRACGFARSRERARWPWGCAGDERRICGGSQRRPERGAGLLRAGSILWDNPPRSLRRPMQRLVLLLPRDDTLWRFRLLDLRARRARCILGIRCTRNTFGI